MNSMAAMEKKVLWICLIFVQFFMLFFLFHYKQTTYSQYLNICGMYTNRTFSQIRQYVWRIWGLCFMSEYINEYSPLIDGSFCVYFSSLSHLFMRVFRFFFFLGFILFLGWSQNINLFSLPCPYTSTIHT